MVAVARHDRVRGKGKRMKVYQIDYLLFGIFNRTIQIEARSQSSSFKKLYKKYGFKEGSSKIKIVNSQIIGKY